MDKIHLKDIKTLKIDDEAEITSGIHCAEKVSTTTGKPFLTVTFDDGVDGLVINIWDNNPLYEELKQIKDIQLCTAVVKYKGCNKGYENYELISYNLISKPSLTDCVEIEKLVNEFRSILSEMPKSEVKNIICDIFKDKTIKNLLFSLPVGEENAYSFKGGILARIVRNCKLISAVSKVFNEWEFNKGGFNGRIDPALMIISAVCQDIGNIKTFSIDSDGKIIKTEAGNMNDSAYYTAILVTKYIEKSKLNDEQKTMLINGILSTKGSLKFGDVSIGRTREAIIFKYISSMDFAMGNFEMLERISLGNNYGKIGNKSYYLDYWDNL